MASIKGYSELVAGGMAGPVNEMQKRFLGTVRSNVDRMNSDCDRPDDLTKTQVVINAWIPCFYGMEGLG